MNHTKEQLRTAPGCASAADAGKPVVAWCTEVRHHAFTQGRSERSLRMSFIKAVMCMLKGKEMRFEHVEYAMKEKSGERMICYKEVDMSWRPTTITERMIVKAAWSIVPPIEKTS